MPNDSDLIDQLNAQIQRLPTELAAFAESLSRQRERHEGAGFALTEAQREQTGALLAALALGPGSQDLPTQVAASQRVIELAEQVRELRVRKKTVEQQLALATEELVREVGVGVAARAPDFGLRIGEPLLRVKVVDPGQLPAAFLTLQPDRKAILEHVRTAAEVPPGAEVSETRPTVYFSK